MTIHGYPANDHLAMRHVAGRHSCCMALPSWQVRQGQTVSIVGKMHRLVSDLEAESDLKGRSKVLRSLVTSFDAELLEVNGSIESEG